MSAGRPAASPKAETSGADSELPPDLPFEAALAQLEDIVRQLERGDVPLDRSVEIYERGEALKRHCETLLKRAESRIQKIALGPDGRPAGTVPLDVE